jgi:hypothetical protein
MQLNAKGQQCSNGAGNTEKNCCGLQAAGNIFEFMTLPAETGQGTGFFFIRIA